MTMDPKEPRCAACGGGEKVRILRARLFNVALCDECVLPYAPMNNEGRELRVIAVATERFSTHRSAA